MAHDVEVKETENEIGAACSCGWVFGVNPDVWTRKFKEDKNPEEAARFRRSYAERIAHVEAFKHRAQGFFADFAAETRKPHFGDQQRSWMNSLLTRAIEAKLYNPEDV